MNMIGMGLGFMIWGSIEVLVGWATGRWVLLGLRHIYHINYDNKTWKTSYISKCNIMKYD